MKTSGRKISLSIILILLSVSVFIPSAEAGILFRNKRNVIRTSQPRFQSQQYKVKRSTAIQRATSGRIFRAREYGGVKDTMKLVRANLKYEEKLTKWNLKNFKANKKLEEKRRKILEKESRRKEKEAARLKKAKERSNKSLLASVAGTDGQISKKADARGALGTNSNSATPTTKTPQKKGFFALLGEALFGKRNQPQ